MIDRLIGDPQVPDQLLADLLSRITDRFGWTPLLARAQPPTLGGRFDLDGWGHTDAFAHTIFITALPVDYPDSTVPARGRAQVSVEGEHRAAYPAVVVTTRPIAYYWHKEEADQVWRTVVHEIGHLGGLKHCATETCVMAVPTRRDTLLRRTDQLCIKCKTTAANIAYGGWRAAHRGSD